MQNSVKFIIGILLLTFVSCYQMPEVNYDITPEEISEHIQFLASDSLKGRWPGTPEAKIAAEYIKVHFQDYGLTLMGENGFQYFDIVSSVTLGDEVSFSLNGIQVDADTGFIPYSISGKGDVSAPVVFAGYGIKIENDSFQWDDFSGISVEGKWVLVMAGIPQIESMKDNFENSDEIYAKALHVADQGGLGLLVVNPFSSGKKDELPKLKFKSDASLASIPVVHVSRGVANDIFGTATDLEEVEKEITGKEKPWGFETESQVDAHIEVVLGKTTTQNVLAMIEGNDDILKNEYVIIGAHYDHLGMGGPETGSRSKDTLAPHNGADDNASGVAGVIELAGALMQMKDSLKRSVIFVAFSSEETGLQGSSAFANEPPVDLDKVSAMFNFDMIGRLDTTSRSLVTGGLGSSLEGESLLDSAVADAGFKLSKGREGYGPSDHASFYAKNIPVFFITTGAHLDYHTINDDWEKINEQGEVNVLQAMLKLTWYIANHENKLTFQEAGPIRKRGGGYGSGVTFGIMPDFAAQGIEGLKVQAVRPDGPAGRGGMQNGDIIKKIDGMSVTNIYDYMERLKKLNPGQTVSVDVERNGEIVVLIFQV